ncbi:MAG: galactose mutarotase, partial [Sphingobacteriales bacterium]
MNSDTTIKEFILENTLGTTLGICNYGASITKCIIANEYGQQTDVVLGF